jgi:hypothetical protein
MSDNVEIKGVTENRLFVGSRQVAEEKVVVQNTRLLREGIVGQFDHAAVIKNGTARQSFRDRKRFFQYVLARRHDEVAIF